MAKFANNNTKHASIGYTLFKLNYGYRLCISYKENIDPHTKSKAADELTEKLRNLIAACRENLKHVQKLQKQAYNKGTKLKSYASGEKV